MATVEAEKVSIPHMERTKGEPRDDNLYRVTIDQIEQVNDQIKLFRLVPVEREGSIKFLPGQWLDVHIPTIPKAGGFTITSAPYLQPKQTSLTTSKLFHDSLSPAPYIELAIQKSPANPPAAFLWRPPPQILGTELVVRVGGSFTWPPPLYQSSSPTSAKLKRVVFIAGGVGINPLMSMLSQIVLNTQNQHPTNYLKINFLYSTRDPGESETQNILFLDRIQKAISSMNPHASFKLFLTPIKTSSETEIKGDGDIDVDNTKVTTERRRIERLDILEALGPVEDRNDVVCYICGVPSMTDEFVDMMKNVEGIDTRNVLFEKWW